MAGNFNVAPNPQYPLLFGGQFNNFNTPEQYAQQVKAVRDNYNQQIQDVLAGNRQAINIQDLPIPTRNAEIEVNIDNLWNAVVQIYGVGGAPPSDVTVSGSDFLRSSSFGNNAQLYQVLVTCRAYVDPSSDVVKQTSQYGKIGIAMKGTRILRGENIGNPLQRAYFLLGDPGPQHTAAVSIDDFFAAFYAKWSQVKAQQNWTNEDCRLKIKNLQNPAVYLARRAQLQVRRALKFVARPGNQYQLNIAGNRNIGVDNYQQFRYSTQVRSFYGANSPYAAYVDRVRGGGAAGGGGGAAGGGGGGAGGGGGGIPAPAPPPGGGAAAGGGGLAAGVGPLNGVNLIYGRFAPPNIDLSPGVPNPGSPIPAGYNQAQANALLVNLNNGINGLPDGANYLPIPQAQYFSRAEMLWRRSKNFVDNTTLGAVGSVMNWIYDVYQLHLAAGGNPVAGLATVENFQQQGHDVVGIGDRTFGFESYAGAGLGVWAFSSAQANGVFVGFFRFDANYHESVPAINSLGLQARQVCGLIYATPSIVSDPALIWNNWLAPAMQNVYPDEVAFANGVFQGDQGPLAFLLGDNFLGQVVLALQPGPGAAPGAGPTYRLAPPSVIHDICIRAGVYAVYPTSIAQWTAMIRDLNTAQVRGRVLGQDGNPDPNAQAVLNL